MMMNSIQQETAQMAKDYELCTDPMTRFADLVSEVGELGKELVKVSDYGKNAVTANEKISMEMGDVMFVFALLANELGLDISACFDMTRKKCQERFEANGHIGSEAANQ